MRLLALLLLAPGAFAVPVTVAEAGQRLEDLEGLLGRAKATDAELIAAIDAVALACTDLAPDPDARERKRFRDGAAAAFLKALRLERVDEATKRNERNDVQLAAARAFRHVDRDRAQDLMRVLERHILEDRHYDLDPSFYDAVLDPLVRLNAKGTFEWLVDDVVNPDTAEDSRDQALAALDALLRLPATGEQRCLAVKRLLAIYQSYMFHVEDDLLEVAGFRGTSTKYRFMQGAGPYWESMRPTVMRALRQLSTDPRTGLPPFDLDTKGEIGTLERHKIWFGQHKTPGLAPWTEAEPEPRPRDAVPYARSIPPAWHTVGAPWTHSWRANRSILDTALPEAPWRDELRAKTLPGIAAAALEDPAWQVRAAAAVTIARIAAPDAAALLRKRIDREPVEAVREAALLGLLLLADPNERDFLRARAADPAENPRVRAYALLALGFLRDIDPLVVASGTRGDLGACAVRAMGLAGAPSQDVADLLADRRHDPMLRGEAGTALLELGDTAALPQVLLVLKERVKEDTTPVAQSAAAIAAGLAPADDARTLAKLERELSDAEGQFGGVRTLLAASFGRIGGARGTTMLAEEYGRLRPNSLRVAERGHFLLALGGTGTDEAKALLRAELKTLDHDWDLGACALGLALAGDPACLPAMRALLNERGDVYAPHGMIALAILKDPASSPLVREVLRRSRSDDVLEEGALALAMLDGEKALPDLLALWERARRPEHYDAFAWAFRLAASPDAIAPLRSIVEGKGDPMERAFALMALGRMADPAAPLHRLARDSNPYAGTPTLLDLARWRDAAPLLE